jgi:hypothetical protein
MTETEVRQLVAEIQHVDFREFWWDSPLLARSATVHDSRVVSALALRHHGLSNKDAFSAHVVRQAIKHSDGSELKTLWSCIDSETDASKMAERMDDFTYLPWASAFIIGEIGGATAFTEAARRLTPSHSARHYLIVRLLCHVVVRYLGIEKESEPQTTFINLNTGDSETFLSRYTSRLTFDMTSRKRSEANELFTPLTRAAIQYAKTRLQLLPDAIFNYPKLDFLHAIDHIHTTTT